MLNQLGARFSSAVQQVDHSMHKGAPNPAHGKFFIVGSIPMACYDVTRNDGKGGSRLYDTEKAAIQALKDAGALVIQDTKCNVVK